MKRFVIKFYALFAIILGVIGYYAWFVQPQISGDLGKIGQIPFGQAYNDSIDAPYKNQTLRVHKVDERAPIADTILTIGDSFSQLGIYGYGQFLAGEIDCDITNVVQTTRYPEQNFVRLVNQGRIKSGSIVVVESVERAVIGRLAELDLEDAEDKGITTQMSGEDAKMNALDGAIVWLRISMGIKKPVQVYRTDRELFSHPARHMELYIYDSKWDHDGDLRFEDDLRKYDVETAWANLYRLHRFAEVHGIQIIYLIAADKYDVYEPYIVDEHVTNPTLDRCPEEQWIVNTKPMLQKAVSEGEKDVYRINDTHWSPIGAEIVASEIARRIMNDE